MSASAHEAAAARVVNAWLRTRHPQLPWRVLAACGGNDLTLYSVRGHKRISRLKWGERILVSEEGRKHPYECRNIRAALRCVEAIVEYHVAHRGAGENEAMTADKSH